MKLTSKGQVTVPQEIREKMGWHGGTEVDIVADVKGVHIRPKSKLSRGEQLVKDLTGKATDRRWTTDQIMAMTRGR